MQKFTMCHSGSMCNDCTQVARRYVWQSRLQLWKAIGSTTRVRGLIERDVYTRTPPNKSQFRLQVPSLEMFQYSEDNFDLRHKLLTITDRTKQFL
jgi:hypothetical protein